MIESGEHLEYIFGAYGLSALLIVLLSVWVVLSYKKQKNRLDTLKAMGLKRRSERTPIKPE
ncbi:heme exporter protein CcmD [Maritalea mediterranea]|uniref:Heme exporter protein D n=1 Tax=Maritalea mediterranea TaxID=2909667 RepID=A0ABS9E1Y1_9HYPH|nr:heme exporter protein CcmD [Maritalea mediterranea]MCF4096875.1 heme exporter protein CcmD [Maritalea mediterranea]